MATGRQGMRRRPSKGAVAGRLIGAFVLGTVVMGGGLYLFDHTRGAQGRGRVGVAGRVMPPGLAEGTGGTPAGAGPDATGRAGVAPSGKAGAGVLAAGDTAGGAGTALPQAPFGESEEVFETGARVYVAHCASCHGRPGKAEGTAGQIWGAGAAAIAAEPVGLLYEQTANGVQQTANGVPAGMRGYRGELHETEMWDVALLLRNAGQELPDPVMRILRAGPGR